jgi:ubiquinone/menaquinone biosynthesis C-methylase UbiE
MSDEAILKEMEEYYRDRVPYHDMCMSYSDNKTMEELLGPIIRIFEKDMVDKDVLEIACGTGNWTQVLSKRARTVVACDFYEGYIKEAEKKEYQLSNVNFMVADAYGLEGIESEFTAAFCGDWFSHVPRSKIDEFLKTMHGKLIPLSKVVIVDMLRSPELQKMFSHVDSQGNEIQIRILPNGKKYKVIKNFFEKDELLRYFEGSATNVNYHEDTKLARWLLSYTLKE